MENAARIFKALAESSRLRLLCLLADGERCVCELMAVVDMPQSTVSRHLAYLRNTGWVIATRRGKWMYYRLADLSGIRRRLFDTVTSLAEVKEGRADHERLALLLREKGTGGCEGS